MSAMLLSDLMLRSPFLELVVGAARWSLMSHKHNILICVEFGALTQTTSDLVPSTLHEQAQPIMLVVENGEQLVRKGLSNAISSARYRDSRAIARCSVHLDPSLYTIVVDVVYFMH